MLHRYLIHRYISCALSLHMVHIKPASSSCTFFHREIPRRISMELLVTDKRSYYNLAYYFTYYREVLQTLVSINRQQYATYSLCVLRIV